MALSNQGSVGRLQMINSSREKPLAHRRLVSLSLSILSAGVDLRGHQPVVRLFRTLLGPDRGQRPRRPVHPGAVRDPGAGLPAALQLHRLEPLWHGHRPGHAEGAR